MPNVFSSHKKRLHVRRKGKRWKTQNWNSTRQQSLNCTEVICLLGKASLVMGHRWGLQWPVPLHQWWGKTQRRMPSTVKGKGQMCFPHLPKKAWMHSSREARFACVRYIFAAFWSWAMNLIGYYCSLDTIFYQPCRSQKAWCIGGGCGPLSST